MSTTDTTDTAETAPPAPPATPSTYAATWLSPPLLAVTSAVVAISYLVRVIGGGTWLDWLLSS